MRKTSVKVTAVRKASNWTLEMHDLLTSRLAPGTEQTKAKIGRKSVITPRVSTPSSDKAKGLNSKISKLL